MMKQTQLLRQRQRGVTLIEALVAMLIMAFGMLALVGLQNSLRRSGDVAKQRGEAVRAAQLDLEQLRSFSVLQAASPPLADVFAYDQIVEWDNDDAGQTASSARYFLSRKVQVVTEPPMTWVNVAVTWNDRGGEMQTVNFGSIIAPADPALGGSLGIAPVGGANRAPLDRHGAIPAAAKDVGGGLSAWKPNPGGSVAWVFNNTTGVIVGLCTSIPLTTSTSMLTSADIASCSSGAAGLLLSGYVRYSFSSPPDPNAPSGTLILPAMNLALTDHPTTPASDCFVSTPTTQTVTYHCVVYMGSATKWTGKLTLNGITLGAGGYKVCRYSADYDGNGAIGNSEHPEVYTSVKAPLTKQNFLVINNGETCPAGHAVDVSLGQFSNTATVQIQP